MNTFFSENKRSYDNFKKQIPPNIQSIFDSLRDYCFSLGSNVIEDVRMHRIVFSKSFTFRWFADLEPEQDAVLLKIQHSRKEPNQTFRITVDDDLKQVKDYLKDAFKTIH